MTLGDSAFPAVAALTAWFRTLPQPDRVWAGTLRIWQAEVALATLPQLPALLERTGLGVADLHERFGFTMPPAKPTRTSVNFLPTATGLVRVDLKGLYLPAWPTPVALTEVPSELPLPQTTGGAPLDVNDWHTIPVLRALAFIGVAVQWGDTVQVHPLKPSAGTIAPEPLFHLSAASFPVVAAEAWERTWQTWCHAKRVTPQPAPAYLHGYATLTKHPAAHHLRTLPEVQRDESWLFAGDDPFHEVALIRLEG